MIKYIMKLKNPKYYFIDNNIVESLNIVKNNTPKQYTHDATMGFLVWFAVSVIISSALTVATFISKQSMQLPYFSFSWSYVIIILNFSILAIIAFFHHIVFHLQQLRHKLLLKSFQKFVFHNPDSLQKLLQFINFNSLVSIEKDIINKDFSENTLSIKTLKILSDNFHKNLLDENLNILTNFADHENSNEKKKLSFFNSTK